MGHFYTTGFETGTLLHIREKQLGHFYTSERSNQDTFTHLGRHKTIVLGRFYTTNGNTLNKSQGKINVNFCNAPFVAQFLLY